MSRLDDAISDLGYILDVMKAYRNITDTGCCNNCASVAECKYKPNIGEMVRYNCPHYVHPWDTGEEAEHERED